ncbi:MAG TPA: TonB-dependent receptor [Myxococcota bacterium]|nr:TonB-dependent receptor [Myxococcota bacterium]HRY94185.1 TonB-dependent receptor [Myxococcota bacterium]HSA21747.1 TonB-dependent receptor [Myxococcota bacterium]
MRRGLHLLLVTLPTLVWAPVHVLAASPGAEEAEPGAERPPPAEPEDEEWKAILWAMEDQEAEAEVITVTADRIEQAADEAAAALTVLDGQAIEDAAATDATALLEAAPGVDVQRMSPGGYGSNVSIRGSSDFKPGGFGNRVLVLLDGRPINAPDTHGVDWSALPLFDLSRVEVLRGPASALYGSTAVGGVVQLFTRPAADGVELTLGQGFGGDEPNQTRIAGSAATRFDSLGLRLSGWYQSYNGLVPPGEGEARYNSDSQLFGLRLTGDGRLSPEHRLDGELSWMGSAGGNPGFEGTSERSRSRRFERDTLGVRLGHRYDRGTGLRTETDLYWNRFGSVVADPGGGNPNAYDTDRAGARSLVHFLLWDALLNTAGVELEYHRVAGDVYALGEGPYDLVAGAIFLQSQLLLDFGLELTGGVRLDTCWFSTHQSYTSASPKLRVAYRPDEDTVLWAAVNRGFRAPSVGELYLRYETSFGLAFQGNPELEPEVLWAFELGLRRQFFADRLKLELVAFWNEGSGTIEFDYRTIPVSAANLEGSRTFGLELALTLTPTRWLELQADASWMDCRDTEDGSRLLYRPEWKGGLWAILHGGGFRLTGHVHGVAARLYDDFLAGGITGIPRRSLPGYLLLDFGLTWTAPHDIELSAYLRNALDERVYVIQDYPSPGREIYVETRIPF